MSSGTNVNKRNPSRGNDTKGPKISLYQQTAQQSSKSNRSGTTSTNSSNAVDTIANLNNNRQQNPTQQSCTDSESTPSIVSSKQQKANQCDRLLSMFDGNQENSRSILRVNLIKKSSRQSNLSPLSSRSRLLQKREPDVPAPENQPANDSGTINSNVTKATKSINCNSKEAKLPSRVGDNKQTKKGDDYLSNYEEAKKSQKLVVSLLKDISKTVAKDDLNEMLKEINLAIGEIQQDQDTEQPKQQQQQHKKRTDRKTDRLNHKAKEAIKSSDTSNSSESKCEQSSVNNFKHEEDNDKTGRSNAINCCNYNKKGSKIELNILQGEGEEEAVKTGSSTLNQHNNDDSSDIRGQMSLRKKLIELSSDEDTGGKDRKPNSSRLPDRCLRITSSHAKYISPHRKRSLEERLNRAQEAREKFLEYRANKFRDILKKVEEMRAWKEEDTLNLKASVQTKLQKAAEKRKEQLDKIIRKAHDEESKVSEIQFINNLEAQNRRHDMNSRKKEFEARLQDLQDERQRRFEEKQAKEVAAEERRKTLEAERKAKLLEIQQRRKLKIQKVEQQQQVKERKRLERTRDRDQKITAIKEAYDAGVQTLRKRIDQKQEQSERRHEVNLRLIRQKAFELSIKRYNSFISETNAAAAVASQQHPQDISINNLKQKQQQDNQTSIGGDTKRLQLKPFNTKKFCNLCKETINSESALFSHLRSEVHHSSISEHYENTMLTTNEAVEIHNLRHIVDTDLPLDADADGGGGGSGGGGGTTSQQSSRASSLVNYYHSSYLSQANGGICMSESDRDSLLAIEKRCRKLRHKLIVAGKPFNRDWFSGKIRSRLAQLLVQQRLARNQSTNTEMASLASTIDLSANNSNCQHNKPFYLKINRITRELISITTDQRISGGGLMPAGIIHSVDRLMADLNKQLTNRKLPQLSQYLLQLAHRQQQQSTTNSNSAKHQPKQNYDLELDVDQLAMATKMIEFYAIDTLFLYDIVSCLVSILRRIVPNVSLTSKLPSTVASHYSTQLIDPISLNSYYCHRAPILSARIYIKMINFITALCENHSDLCYVIFQSNNMIFLSDILSYRLGFIIGNESPASSISGSSSAATLSAAAQSTIDSTSAASCNRKPPAASRPGYSLSSASSLASVRNAAATGFKLNQMKSRQHQRVAGRRGQLSQHNGDYYGAGDGDDDDQDENDGDGEDEEDDDDDDDGRAEQEVEGESWDRTETYKRTEEVVDDMTAGLCKLLATVTETILSRPLMLLNQLDKAAFDQRSDDFISYMVQVGIVDTESVIMSHIHQQQQQQQQQQQHHQNQRQRNNHGSQNNISSNMGGGPVGANSISLGSDRSSLEASAAAAAAATGAASVPGSSSTVSQQQQQTTLATQPISQASAVMGSSSSTSTSTSTATTTSNNKIINFTTSCIKFVTSLVKLVIAKLPPDDDCERGGGGGGHLDRRPPEVVAQQDTTQLLVTLKMTQLSGVLTLVYDMLVQAFNSLTDQQQQQQNNSTAPASLSSGPNPMPQQQQHPDTLERQLALALHSIRLINYVAYIDIGLLQQMLASDEMLPLQLRHVCSYLIAHLVQSQFKLMEDQVPMEGSGSESHHFSSNSNPSSSPDLSSGTGTGTGSGCSGGGDILKNELLNEIILLLGHFAYLNKSNQMMLKSGCRRPTIIEQLVQLPFDYFSRTKLKLVLMPTLISCAYLNDQICSLVCRELSLSMLNSFIEDQLLAAQLESGQHQHQHQQNQKHQQQTQTQTMASDQKKVGGGQFYSLMADDLTSTKLVTSRWRFERRFAKSKWLSAKKYFDSQQSKMRQQSHQEPR